MSELAMFLMISFCDYSPLIDNFNECVNELTQCKTDDSFTMNECINEYKTDLENEKI